MGFVFSVEVPSFQLRKSLVTFFESQTPFLAVETSAIFHRFAWLGFFFDALLLSETSLLAVRSYRNKGRGALHRGYPNKQSAAQRGYRQL